MNLLAFDTCFDACSVAAGRRLRSLTPTIAFDHAPMATGQAERLMPMIDEVMRDAGLTFSELSDIVVTTGPGTFTGARISVSAARALALATGARIIEVSSLALMAMSPSVVSNGRPTTAIATDARRGEVYIQVFCSRSLEARTAPQLLSIADAACVLGGGRTVIAGSAAAAVAEAARARGVDAVATEANLLPDAIDMLFAALSLKSSETVAPLYLRPPDAKPHQPSPFVGSAA